MNTTNTTFKRIEVGTKFLFKGNSYRKVSKTSAFKMLPSGRGDTANYIPFTRSASVLAEK